MPRRAGESGGRRLLQHGKDREDERRRGDSAFDTATRGGLSHTLDINGRQNTEITFFTDTRGLRDVHPEDRDLFGGASSAKHDAAVATVMSLWRSTKGD